MDTHQGTVTIWQSGRLAPHAGDRRIEFTREQAIVAALLLLSTIVMAMYVAVLERDVDGSEMAHVQQRARAVAQAQCEADRSAELRGRCIALLNGDVAADEAPAPPAPGPVRYEQDNAARAMTVSLVADHR